MERNDSNRKGLEMGIQNAKPLPYDETDLTWMVLFQLKRQSILFQIAITLITISIVSFVVTVTLIGVNESRRSSSLAASS